MAGLFISYRRDESAYVAKGLADALRNEFPDVPVFLDVESMPYGVDFRVYIDDAISGSDLVLVLIGDYWALSMDGKRRLDDVEDYVRMEMLAALQYHRKILPVLHGNARMPSENEVPKELNSILFINAAELRSGRNFSVDMERLVSNIRMHLNRDRPPMRNALENMASRNEGINVVEPSQDGDGYRIERLLATFTAMIVVVFVLYLVGRNERFEDDRLVVLLRIVLAVAMGVIGATIPGFLHIQYTRGGLSVRAAGAMAVAVMSYFVTPRVDQLNLVLPPAKIEIDVPTVVDIRPVSGVNSPPEVQWDSSIYVTADMTYRNIGQPAKNAFLQGTMVEFFTNTGPQYFDWIYFVNMHEEAHGKNLGIEQSAGVKTIDQGKALYLEIVHRPRGNFSWGEFISFIEKSKENTVEFLIRSRIDGTEFASRCTVAASVWRVEVEKYMNLNKHAPPRLTMCCVENGRTATNPKCLGNS